MRHAVVPAVVLLAAVTASATPPVKHAFQSSAPRGNVRRVIIDIPETNLTIRNGAADRLAVSGTVVREPDSERSRDGEQKIVDATSVDIYTGSEEAIVKRRFGPDAQSWRAQKFSTYTVTLELPPDVEVDVLTTAGDVSVDGSFGDLNIDLRSGDVKVRMPKAVVKELTASARVGQVWTRIGDEIVERQGVFPGKTHFSNPDGKSIVKVHVTAGEVNVELTK